MAVSRLDSIMNSAQNLSPEFQKVFQASVIADRKPIAAIEEKRDKLQSKLGLLNDVIGKVDNIKKIIPTVNTPMSMMEIALKSNDERVITGVAEKGVAPVGDFNVEVHRLASPASALSNGFPDKDETRIGTGYLSVITPDGETKEIFIDNESATLEGLTKVINSAGVGLRASVVVDNTDTEAPYRLMLTGTKAGAENNFEYPDFYFIDGEEDFFIESEKPAMNALVSFEGQEFESPNNELRDIIPGVTLSLKGISDGRPVTIHVEQDTEKTSLKLKDLVTGLNEVFSFIQKQVPNEQTDTSRTLGNDYGLKVAEQRLRGALIQQSQNTEGRRYRSLGDIGISLTKEGVLSLDEKKLEKALTENYEEVADILIGTDLKSGVIPRISTALQTISSPGQGVLTNQKNNFIEQTKKLDKDQVNRERFLEKRAETLKNKLAKAQGALTAMQQQQGRIAAAIPSGG